MRTVVDIVAELDQRDLLELARRVARKHSLSVEEMLGPWRGPAESHARHLLWAVLYARGHWSTTRIGALFGKDHTTVLLGMRRVTKAETDEIEPTEKHNGTTG